MKYVYSGPNVDTVLIQPPMLEDCNIKVNGVRTPNMPVQINHIPCTQSYNGAHWTAEKGQPSF